MVGARTALSWLLGAHLYAKHEDDADQLRPRKVVKAFAHRHLQQRSGLGWI